VTICTAASDRNPYFGDPFDANKLGPVFTTKNGTPLEPRNVNRAFGRCADELMCEAFGCTTFGIRVPLLFGMGVEAATVQRILRHSSISVTTGYVDVIEQVRRAAVAGMDSLLSPAR
jgi:site-specific recombinase XerD